MKMKITGLNVVLLLIFISLMVTACNTNKNAAPNQSLTQNRSQKSVRPLAVENEVTTRIKNAAQKVSGVQKTTVAIQGVDVIVGVEVNNLVKNKRQMEWDVYNEVKKVEPHYNVYVTTSSKLNNRLKQSPLHVGTRVQSVQNNKTEVKGIIQDIGKQFVIP